VSRTYPELVNLRGGGVAVVIDLSGPTPVVLHWGADLGADVDRAQFPADAVPHSSYESPHVDELVPQASSGWRGRPALEGHRAGGQGFSPALVTTGASALGDNGWEITLEDSALLLRVTVELTLSAEGMLRARSSVDNLGTTGYSLLSLSTTLPIGSSAAEVLDLSGRWCREQHPQRQSLRHGTWSREYRHGRTGHDSSVLTAVGSAGFSNRTGRVWATHLGFSGNHETFVERAEIGATRIGNAELFSPGELELAAGERYTSPYTYATFSASGVDGVTRAFHSYVRSRSTHPRSPRPVVLNTWEAVYFDHELENLLDLAAHASAVGVERFVLDDGWFRNRRNDSAGLGDWYVDDDVWPEGFGALIEGVRSHGLEFGLWVEPEMVNADSDVIRAHPDWISGPGLGRTPPEWRNQQVIDLVNPDAWNYVFERIDALLSENAISYLKWDQNRDLTEMGHDGAPSTHAQTLAAYRLFDALRAAHPDVEIESCSSGGARVDLGILERTDRVWASDCNDALERQTIQRWTGAVLPPELVGSHVGPTRAHTTHRSHSLSFRAITAMFGHFGIEWDIRTADAADVAELTRAVALYKKYRALIHTGVAVHADLSDPAYALYGSVTADGSEGVFAFVSVATSALEAPGRIEFPGLDPHATYEVTVEFPDVAAVTIQRGSLGWVESGAIASGAVLAEVGLPMPILAPEHAILIHVARKDV
jgi:alpha-galactosidase